MAPATASAIPLAQEAVTKPGTLDDAYSRFWNYSFGQESMAAFKEGFTKGGDFRTRDYWTGLFAHGFTSFRSSNIDLQFLLR
jgi:hypothetical protein